MARKRLLLDVDEVLADFQTPTYGIIERLFGRKLTPYDYEVWDMFSLFDDEQKKAIFAEVGQPSFCRSLKPKPGAIEAVKELRGIVDLFAVTSHFPSATWVHERDAWLHDLFGFERREVIHTSAKFMVIGDALLDDNPSHVTAWMDEHPLGLGMLWHIPNTRTLGMDDIRVHTWEEVVSRAKTLDQRKTVWDLLDDAEWDFYPSGDSAFPITYAEFDHLTNVYACRECRVFAGDSPPLEHKSDCSLGKVTSWINRRSR